MASIRKEIRINAPASQIWDALRDVGALHTRLVPGFVTDTKMEGNTRIVTFGNGMDGARGYCFRRLHATTRGLGGGRSVVSPLQRRGLGGVRPQRRLALLLDRGPVA